MGEQKKSGATRKKVPGKIEKVRLGLPPMSRGTKQGGSKKSANFKRPTKPKAKDTLRDGSPKAKK
jgi:hypothetical protein